MIEGLVEGRIVNYVLGESYVPEDYKGLGVGKIRPAIVLKVWDADSGCSNLTVFVDWSNDGNYTQQEYQGVIEKSAAPCIWATSVTYSQDLLPCTWHWPTESAKLRKKRADFLASQPFPEAPAAPPEAPAAPVVADDSPVSEVPSLKSLGDPPAAEPEAPAAPVA